MRYTTLCIIFASDPNLPTTIHRPRDNSLAVPLLHERSRVYMKGCLQASGNTRPRSAHASLRLLSSAAVGYLPMELYQPTWLVVCCGCGGGATWQECYQRRRAESVLQASLFWSETVIRSIAQWKTTVPTPASASHFQYHLPACSACRTEF